jgi:hypothetical protein
LWYSIVPKKCLNVWKEVALRDPTPAKIANETSLSLQEAETLTRKMHEKTGWSMPNQAIIENAAERLGEVLVCAARIRDVGLQKMRENFDYDNEPDIVEAANVFLGKHRELLPKLVDDENEIAWAPEALKCLGRDYKPKNRIIPHVYVVPRG